MYALRYAVLGIMGILLAASITAAEEVGGRLPVETFEVEPLSVFPSRWEARGDRAAAGEIYRVAGGGQNHFLEARAEDRGVQIGIRFPFDPQRYPVLSWRWRVATFPEGADERVKGKNDSAAGVYVVFPGRLLGLLPRTLKYVWSREVPVGERFASPGYGNTQIIVLESGPAHGWRTARVDVRADYVAFFGSDPPMAKGIGVLTDADNTHSAAGAFYDDFVLLSTNGHVSSASAGK